MTLCLPALSQQKEPSTAAPDAAGVDRDVVAEALAAKAGGLTADEAGRRAAKASHTARGKYAELAAASARVDQALVAYFPRLTVTATYTRLSPVDNLIVVGACRGNPTQICQGSPEQIEGVPLQNYRVPIYLNHYSLVGTISVPISDYVLRISQSYAAAAHAADAKKLEAKASSLQAAADAKVAFYNWTSALGQLVVAQQAVAQAKSHVDAAKQLLETGRGSRADVLRLDSLHANAQQFEADARVLAQMAEAQLRTTIEARRDERLEPGVNVMSEPSAPPAQTLEGLEKQALERRLEIRALDETRYSLKSIESNARAGYAPRVEAFGNGYYSNPNPRIIGAQDKFAFTWDAGVRVTWTINDTFTALGAVAEARAQVVVVEEQKAALRNALHIEVLQAHADTKRAAVAVEAADRGLASAEESLRVRRELFRVGRASAVDIIDADTDVTRARLNRLTARVGLLVAKTRLDHATGRDAIATTP
jgi:outer membrane protein TolC